MTNCAILGRVESFASKTSPIPALIDGISMGIGFTWVLVVLGGVREIIGTGKLFDNASLLLGDSFHFLEITVIPDYRGLLIAILPPGGFLILGTMLMLKQKGAILLKKRAQQRAALNDQKQPSVNGGVHES